MVPHPPRLVAALLAAGICIAMTASPAPAADLIVEGCNEMLSGEVGVREAVGNVGDTIQVPITVNATSDIDAFSVDLMVPTGGLQYVDTQPGDLTEDYELVDGHPIAPGVVRVAGIGTLPIPSGAAGRIAVVRFLIVGPGAGAFSTDRLLDDLAGYVSCEDVHGTTRITPVEWGKVKALYRN